MEIPWKILRHGVGPAPSPGRREAHHAFGERRGADCGDGDGSWSSTGVQGFQGFLSWDTPGIHLGYTWDTPGIVGIISRPD